MARKPYTAVSEKKQRRSVAPSESGNEDRTISVGVNNDQLMDQLILHSLEVRKARWRRKLKGVTQELKSTQERISSILTVAQELEEEDEELEKKAQEDVAELHRLYGELLDVAQEGAFTPFHCALVAHISTISSSSESQQMLFEKTNRAMSRIREIGLPIPVNREEILKFIADNRRIIEESLQGP